MTPQYTSPISSNNMTSVVLTAPRRMDSMHNSTVIDAGAENCHVLAGSSTAHLSLHGRKSSDDIPVMAHKHAAHDQHAPVVISDGRESNDVTDEPTQVTLDRPAAPSKSDPGIEECLTSLPQGTASGIARCLIVAAEADSSKISAEIVNLEAANGQVLPAGGLLQAERDIAYSQTSRKQLGNKDPQKVNTCDPLGTRNR